MRPLGPMNGKSLGTTISTWITPIDAMEPFRVPAPSLSPPPASYLQLKSSTNASFAPATQTVYSLTLQVHITPSSSAKTSASTLLSSTPLASSLYWTFPSLLAHATINNCPLRSGDLLATGTVSGPAENERGCLMERTFGGKRPVKLDDGTERGYGLWDGDEIRLSAFASASASAPGGLEMGDCVGWIVPADDIGF